MRIGFHHLLGIHDLCLLMAWRAGISLVSFRTRCLSMNEVPQTFESLLNAISDIMSPIHLGNGTVTTGEDIGRLLFHVDARLVAAPS